MDVAECLEKGLLKRDRPDMDKALRSVQKAAGRAERALKLAGAGFLEDAVVAAYSAMFHAARALLFRDGFKERSHYGLYVYISEKYKERMERRFLVQFDYLRQERHEVIYSLEESKVAGEEAETAISLAKEFIEAVKKLL